MLDSRPITQFASHLHTLLAIAAATLLTACGNWSVDPAQRTQDTVGSNTTAEAHQNGGDDQQPVLLKGRDGLKVALSTSGRTGTAAFNGRPRAHLDGAFGPLFGWPVMRTLMVALVDGRVLGYGNDTTDKQGSTMQYAMWDPSLGNDSLAFMTVPNSVGTVIFCGGQTLLPGTRQVRLVGGDASVNGARNYATKDVSLYNAATNSIAPAQAKMASNRWYTSVVTQANSEQAGLSGRNDREYAGTISVPATKASYINIPEMRSQDGTWRSFANLSSDYAYGAVGNSWFYPRA